MINPGKRDDRHANGDVGGHRFVEDQRAEEGGPGDLGILRRRHDDGAATR